jgi:hypothetical protein
MVVLLLAIGGCGDQSPTLENDLSVVITDGSTDAKKDGGSPDAGGPTDAGADLSVGDLSHPDQATPPDLVSSADLVSIDLRTPRWVTTASHPSRSQYQRPLRKS